MGCNIYCLKCKKSYFVSDLNDYSIIKRKLKNGLTTSILCGFCDKCGSKTCTIIGNSKTVKRKVQPKAGGKKVQPKAGGKKASGGKAVKK